MKLLVILFLCCLIMYGGFYNITKSNRQVKTVDSIIRLVKYIKTEMNYKKPDYNYLLETASRQGFYGVEFKNGEITCGKWTDDATSGELNCFVSRIGTTDREGQLELCDEYILRFTEIYKSMEAEQKGKSQVSLAISLMCAVTVFVVLI